MLLCYGGIDQVLVVIYSNRYLGIVGYIYCCMQCLFAAVSSSFSIVLKYNVMVGAANVIKFYCSHKVLFRRFSPAAGIWYKHLFQEHVYKLSFFTTKLWCSHVYLTKCACLCAESLFNLLFKFLACVDPHERTCTISYSGDLFFCSIYSCKFMKNSKIQI